MTPAETTALRKSVFNAFDPQGQKPIDQNSDEYVELFDESNDPVLAMRDSIAFGAAGRYQTFSGSRGSGKSTQLTRLARMLKDDLYTVIHINSLEYFNPAEPITPEELLLVLASALSEAVKDTLGFNPAHQGYLSRLWDFLRLTKVQIDELELSTSAETAEASFKVQFRTTESFRNKLRDLLSTRTEDVAKHTSKFFQNIADQLATKQPGRTGFVLIVDQFEQIRGNITNADKVIESVLSIFSQHEQILAMPGWHIIYTVPPWLHLAHPGSVDLACFLPCIKLWENTPPQAKREPYLKGWVFLREVVKRRVKHDNMRDLFGPPVADGTHPILEKIIGYSGGHFRDLMGLVAHCALIARVLPIQDSHVEAAIAKLTGTMPVTEEDVRILHKVWQTHQDCRPDRLPATTMAYALLLDNHVILEFRNGTVWFDIHPAIVQTVRASHDMLTATK